MASALVCVGQALVRFCSTHCTKPFGVLMWSSQAVPSFTNASICFCCSAGISWRFKPCDHPQPYQHAAAHEQNACNGATAPLTEPSKALWPKISYDEHFRLGSTAAAIASSESPIGTRPCEWWGSSSRPNSTTNTHTLCSSGSLTHAQPRRVVPPYSKRVPSIVLENSV